MSGLSCERCGGSLRAEAGTSLLRCPYCGDAARLAPAVVDELRNYRQGVAEQLAVADEQALFARAYANVSGADTPPANALPPAQPITGAKCASCGASNSFAVGATFSTCTQCGASLLATPQIQMRGLSAAARTARAARLEALKSERYFAFTLARKHRVLSYFLPVSAIGVPAIAALAFALSDLPDASTQALGAGAASILAVGIVGAVMLWRRAQRARAESAVAAVAKSYAGDSVIGVHGITEWLNVHWSDSYYVYDLSSAFNSQSISCTVRGYPALVIANPVPGFGTPFLDVLLSAWLEGHSGQGNGPSHKAAPDARAALQAQGFTLRSGPSGVHATIRGAVVRERLQGGLELEAALESLALLASSLGGTPS